MSVFLGHVILIQWITWCFWSGQAEGQSQQWEDGDTAILGNEDLDHSLEDCQADVTYHNNNACNSIFLWLWCFPTQTWSLVQDILVTAGHIMSSGCSPHTHLAKLSRLCLWCLSYMMKAMFCTPTSSPWWEYLLDLRKRIEIWHRKVSHSPHCYPFVVCHQLRKPSFFI